MAGVGEAPLGRRRCRQDQADRRTAVALRPGPAAAMTSKPVGASVVRRAHYVLSSILADAVTDRQLARNPATAASRKAGRREGVKLPRLTSKRKMYLTHGQVAALADAARRAWGPWC